jgi:hypothetical protein
MTTTFADAPASSAQRNFLALLVKEREVTQVQLQDATYPHLTKRAATKLIGDLKQAPKAGSAPQIEEGFYFKDETVYKVVNSKAGRPYAKKLSISETTNKAGETVQKGTWVYEPGMVYQLQELTKLSANMAALFGKKTGVCMICGRTLTVKASVDAGIGPICQSNIS